MECFPNGQCFDVKPLILTTPEPTALEPAIPEPIIPMEPSIPEPMSGKFYRRGKEIVECFPNGKCDVVDLVIYDAQKTCWISGGDGINNGNEYGDYGNKFGNGGLRNDKSADFRSPDVGVNNEANGNSGINGDSENKIEEDMHGYWDYEYDDDYDTEETGQDAEPANTGKAVCTFKNSVAVQGTIILVEEVSCFTKRTYFKIVNNTSNNFFLIFSF